MAAQGGGEGLAGGTGAPARPGDAAAGPRPASEATTRCLAALVAAAGRGLDMGWTWAGRGPAPWLRSTATACPRQPAASGRPAPQPPGHAPSAGLRGSPTREALRTVQH